MLEAELNRTNLNTPWGSSTWNGNTQNVALSPELQALFNRGIDIAAQSPMQFNYAPGSGVNAFLASQGVQGQSGMPSQGGLPQGGMNPTQAAIEEARNNPTPPPQGDSFDPSQYMTEPQSYGGGSDAGALGPLLGLGVQNAGEIAGLFGGAAAGLSGLGSAGASAGALSGMAGAAPSAAGAGAASGAANSISLSGLSGNPSGAKPSSAPPQGGKPSSAPPGAEAGGGPLAGANIPGLGVLNAGLFAMTQAGKKPQIRHAATEFGGSPYLSSVTGEWVGPNMRDVLDNGAAPNWGHDENELTYMDVPRIGAVNRWSMATPMNYELPGRMPGEGMEAWAARTGQEYSPADPRTADHQQALIDLAETLRDNDMTPAERRQALADGMAPINQGFGYVDGRYEETPEGMVDTISSGRMLLPPGMRLDERGHLVPIG